VSDYFAFLAAFSSFCTFTLLLSEFFWKKKLTELLIELVVAKGPFCCQGGFFPSVSFSQRHGSVTIERDLTG